MESPALFHHRSELGVILVLAYAGIAAGRIPGLMLNRTGIAMLGAIAILVIAGVSVTDAISYINWPTILLLFGLFVISAQLRLSGLYHKIADGISDRLGHPARFLLILMLVAGGLSAVLNNDVICVVFTPIIATALLRRNLNPVPFLIALAISSNLGAAATLIGNSQNMMIGEIAHLSFGRYLLWSITPVLAAMGFAYGIIWLLSRKRIVVHTSRAAHPPLPDYPFDRGHAIKGLIILTAVIGLFFSSLPRELIVLTAAAIHLASHKFRTEDLLALVDWQILMLFMALFVITGAFQSTGYGASAVHALSRAGVDLQSPATLALTTTFLSNLINNSAAVMLLLKFVNLTHPATGYILAAANSFGGNLLIVGSVANIIVVQQARQSGVDISFRAFARLGIPSTLAALGGLILWAALLH